MTVKNSLLSSILQEITEEPIGIGEIANKLDAPVYEVYKACVSNPKVIKLTINYMCPKKHSWLNVGKVKYTHNKQLYENTFCFDCGRSYEEHEISTVVKLSKK